MTLARLAAILVRVKYVTRLERFVAGDFPMVCARSGKPATVMVPVQAHRGPIWPPWRFYGLFRDIPEWDNDSPELWGQMPFADTEVGDIQAVYEESSGVILRGVHPDFVAAVKESQGRA